MKQEELDAYRVVRIDDVVALTAMSRTSIYRMEAEGVFPRRIQLNERATAWRLREIVEWINSRPLADPTYEAKKLTG
jgi:prophage regulatory protein